MIDNTFYKKVAVVGKNSNSWKSIKENFLKFSIIIDEFSHKDIKQINNNFYQCIIIFSFSYKNEQNQFLLKSLEKTTKVIYISTVTTICAQKNYLYRYPNIKLMAERFLLEKCNVQYKVIIRCGIIEGTHNLPNGNAFFTQKSKLVYCLIDSMKSQNKEKEIIHLYKNVISPFNSNFEKLIYKFYSCININPICALIARPFDFFLKKIGFSWYGYHFVTCKLLGQHDK